MALTSLWYYLSKNLTFSQLKNRSFLRKECRQLRGHIMDLGCGNGEYSFLMARIRTNHITALDSSPERRGGIQKLIRENAHSNITVVDGDAHQLPWKANTFDAVFCNTVLEHVPHPEQVIKEIHRVLKKQGTVLLSIPFLQEIHADPYDFQRYTPHGMKIRLEEAGFQIKKIQMDAGSLNALEYLLLGSIVWRIRLGFWKNMPFGYAYICFLALFFLAAKLGHLLFYPLQKNDRHFMTQVTAIATKK